MSRKSMILCLFLFASASAQLCEKQFYMQSAVQIIREGSSTDATLQETTTTVRPNLAKLEVLYNTTEYKIITGFQGSCEPDTEEIVYQVKPSKSDEFSREVENDLYVKLYSSSDIQLTGTSFDVWFAFSSAPTIPPIAHAIGRNGDGEPFFLWYGATYWTDSTRDPGTGLWSSATQHYFLNLVSHYDSAYVDSILMAPWKDISFDENRAGYLRVQILKALYDTIPTIFYSLALSADPAADTITSGDSLVLTASVTMDSAWQQIDKSDAAALVSWELAGVPDASDASLKNVTGATTVFYGVKPNQAYTIVATFIDTAAKDTIVQQKTVYVKDSPTPVAFPRSAIPNQETVSLLINQNGIVRTLGFKLARPAPSRIDMFTAAGSKVTSIKRSAHGYFWDGLTSHGALAPPGLYLVMAHRTIIGKFLLF